ncbi:hypothetical protein JOQ06_024408 [Pogonophryne albipinna]|uniref:RING-type domain-containing protein n=1 Tax=Pogonophryne albipinna TaxID=1090488 RepID=A0AAD6ABC7_9TELE|nr:hypothetical protein JOQ06_024408 [Pogonophryne albipinna]
MSQEGAQLDQDAICCSICLDVLKEPATIPCGHSFCIKCFQTHWDKEDEEEVYSCPQCRQSFTPRPVLLKSIIVDVHLCSGDFTADELSEAISKLKPGKSPGRDNSHPEFVTHQSTTTSGWLCILLVVLPRSKLPKTWRTPPS